MPHVGKYEGRIPKDEVKIANRKFKMSRRSKISPQTEQAIMLTLLEVPAFRRKAGLPPRDGYHGGDSLATLGRLLGCSRESVRIIERRAMHKLRAACCADPELRHAITHLFNK